MNRTDESIEYSKEAIALIMKHKDAYIHDNDEEAAKQIMKAANRKGNQHYSYDCAACHDL